MTARSSSAERRRREQGLKATEKRRRTPTRSPTAIELPADTNGDSESSSHRLRKRRSPFPLQVTGSVQPNESRVSHVRPAGAWPRAGRARQGRRSRHAGAGARGVRQHRGRRTGDAVRHRARGARALAGATGDGDASGRAQSEAGRDWRRPAERVRGERSSEQRQIEASIQAQQSTLAGMEARLRRYGLADGSGAGRAITSIRSPAGWRRHARHRGAGRSRRRVERAVCDRGHLARLRPGAGLREGPGPGASWARLASIEVDAYPDERFTGKVVSHRRRHRSADAHGRRPMRRRESEGSAQARHVRDGRTAHGHDAPGARRSGRRHSELRGQVRRVRPNVGHPNSRSGPIEVGPDGRRPHRDHRVGCAPARPSSRAARFR